jgi:tRNA threonylcarbamoyladenosine biosynthesis protein TsaE
MKTSTHENSFFSKTFFPKTSQETEDLGVLIASKLKADSVLCFFGELGAGKTTLIKGIAKGLGIRPEEVSSPTFQLLHIYNASQYKTSLPLFHFDLYRLRTHDEFLSMGFEEHFFKGGISCIEWAERIEQIIPEQAIKITIAHSEDGARKISLQ